jgi:hypothetical protein
MTSWWRIAAIALLAASGWQAIASAEPERPVMQQAEAKPTESAAAPKPASPQPADPRTPAPSPEARRASLARVKEIFADDYAAAGPPAKKAEFAKRLAEQAGQTQDAADRWALLTESLRMATDGGDVATALPLIDRIPAEFAVERHASRLDALTRLGTKAAGPALDEVAAAVLDLARDADKAGDEDVATKAIALASGIARKTKNAGLLADATRLQQKSKERQKVTKELAPLLEKVAATPADPEANLEAGRALCLKAERWDEGLPLLAKGSDAALARLAAAERANPTAPADLIKLADGWRDWADAQKPPWKLPAQTRAAATYGRIVNDLQGLDKARVEKRIANVAASGGGTGQTVFLADLQETEVRDVLDEHAFARDGKLYGKPFTVKGKQYTKAIMSLPKANSTAVVYRLPAGAVRLRGHVGIFTPDYAKPDDQPASPLTFEIVADGTVVWCSPGLKKRDDTALFDVAIRNASKLELRITATGRNTNAWAAWLDPVIVK